MKELTLFAHFLTIKETGPYSHTSSMGSNVVRCHDSRPRWQPNASRRRIQMQQSKQQTRLPIPSNLEHSHLLA